MKRGCEEEVLPALMPVEAGRVCSVDSIDDARAVGSGKASGGGTACVGMFSMVAEYDV